jgi:hypothetical protein
MIAPYKCRQSWLCKIIKLIVLAISSYCNNCYEYSIMQIFDLTISL